VNYLIILITHVDPRIVAILESLRESVWGRWQAVHLAMSTMSFLISPLLPSIPSSPRWSGTAIARQHLIVRMEWDGIRWDGMMWYRVTCNQIGEDMTGLYRVRRVYREPCSSATAAQGCKGLPSYLCTIDDNNSTEPSMQSQQECDSWIRSILIL
jgi:hypothetical protein